MKSLFYAFLFLFSFSFIMSCSDSDVTASTGPEGVSTKLDTLESPARVWIDTAAIYLNLDTTEYFFIDTITYEVAEFNDDGSIDTTFYADVVISSKDTLVTYNEPAGMLRVNWAEVENADYYYVLVTDTGKGTKSYYWGFSKDSLISDGQGNFSKVINDLTPEYSYDVYVFGYNSVRKERGARTKSDRAIHLKGASSPATINVSVTGNTARVEWSEVEDARKYNVIYTDILTDSAFIKTTTGAELSTLIDVKENSAYKVRVVPEGFVVVDSTVDSMLIEIGPSFSKIDTIYPYDPSLPKDSTTFLLPYVIFSTFENLSDGSGMHSVKGGYYLKGNIWSSTGQDSLEEVVVSSFQLGVNEVTNREYVEFLNYIMENDVSLVDSLSGEHLLDSIFTFEKDIWDSTVSVTVKPDSTFAIGDTVTSKIFVQINKIFNAEYLDTLTAEDSLLFPGNIIFSVEDKGDIYYDTIIKDTFVYYASVADTLTLSDTITLTAIITDSTKLDSLILDTTFSQNVTFSDTVNDTIWIYSKIGIVNKGYSLLEANSLIKIAKDSLDTIVVVDSAYYNNPVKGITWEGAAAYCNWLSEINGYRRVFIESDSTFTIDTAANGYRMPTEAEYEYFQSAAFLGTRQKYCWGSIWYGNDTTLNVLSSINSLKEYFGVKGVNGNLIEWCMDNVDYNSVNNSISSLVINPVNITGSDHVLKGGAFSDEDKATTFTSDYNLEEKPSSLSSVGFRIAR